MAVKMLACMSSKTLEPAALEHDCEQESKIPMRSNLRKTKSFTCQSLIHPSWSFKSQGNHSRDLSRDPSRDQSISSPLASPLGEENREFASEKPVGKGWKSFFAALQCSRAPNLRSSVLKGMASTLTAGVCTHSCRPCSASASEHDATHAVHPEVSMDSADSFNDANFSLPFAQEQSPVNQAPNSVLQVQNLSSLTDDPGSNLGDGPASARSSQSALPEQKSNPPSKPPTPRNESPSFGSYHLPNGAAVKAPEELRLFNRLVPPKAGVPGTEWFSQVELGVFITFVTLSNGCNALKRIRFSRDIFSKKEAEAWWAEKGNRVCAVYNVPAFERTTTTYQHAPSRSEEEVSGVSGYATPAYSPHGSRGLSSKESLSVYNSSGISRDVSFREASIRDSIRDSMMDAVSEVSDSVTADRATETETHDSEEGSERTFDGEPITWVEEDVPGVYLTMKNMVGGGRELKRVRFSREKFTETQAKIWWDENRGRIHKQYL